MLAMSSVYKSIVPWALGIKTRAELSRKKECEVKAEKQSTLKLGIV